MAQRLITIDDIDGSEGAEKTTFSVDGANFTIDLTEPNKKALYEALLPFIKRARRVAGGRIPDAVRAMVGDIPALPPAAKKPRNPERSPDAFTVHSKADLAAVRAFAAELGIKVGDKRISQDVWDCWRSAQEAEDGKPNLKLLAPSRRPGVDEG